MNISEQWKLNGDCDKCRRKKYCKKACKINKVNTENDFLNLVGTVMMKKLRGEIEQ